MSASGDESENVDPVPDLITVECEECKKPLEIPSESYGLTGECPICGKQTVYITAKEAKEKRAERERQVKAAQQQIEEQERAVKQAAANRAYIEKSKVIKEAPDNTRYLVVFGCGLLMLLYGLFMDTSVPTGSEGRMHNTGLLNDALKYTIAGSGICIMAGVSSAVSLLRVMLHNQRAMLFRQFYP